MKGKVAFVLGGAIGYVVGTRSGRQRYEKIKSRAQEVWAHPKVREARGQVAGFAQDKAAAATHTVADKAAGAAVHAVHSVTDKVKGDRPGSTPA